jgi:hypothetical protein
MRIHAFMNDHADSILLPGLSCRTWLTHHSGYPGVYQDIALDGGLEAQYQATMREVDLWRRGGHRPVGYGNWSKPRRMPLVPAMLPHLCTNEVYEELMRAALTEAKAARVTHLAADAGRVHYEGDQDREDRRAAERRARRACPDGPPDP